MNLLFQISGSEYASNCQSHVISVNEALYVLSVSKRFEISMVHVPLADSKQKIRKAGLERHEGE